MSPPRLAISRLPLSLTFSYIVDWFVILGIAIIGAIFWHKPANRRPFSPVDPSISYPHVLHEKVSTATLAFVSVFIPAVLTAVIALTTTPAVVPPTSTSNATSHIKKGRKATAWRHKLWEWHAAWLGLFLALAVTFLFVEGLKDIMGKPRPDLLARCDLDPALVLIGGPEVVGGLEGALPLWNGLVTWTACRQKDEEILADGFQSFPSGHSAFSWCGMLYLTLYLCAKFSITTPYLLPEYCFHPAQPPSHSRNRSKNYKKQPISSTNTPPSTSAKLLQPRLTAAAPPAFLFPLVLIPIGTATYIASSRFFDFRHHGFDIIVGSLLGMAFAWVGFRMYHLPVRRGRGWSWGARARGREWGVGVGVGGNVMEDIDSEGEDAADVGDREVGRGEGGGDVEMGFLRGRRQEDRGVGDGDIGKSGVPAPIPPPPPPPPPPAGPPPSTVLRPVVRDSRLQRPNGYNSWQADGLRSV